MAILQQAYPPGHWTAYDEAGQPYCIEIDQDMNIVHPYDTKRCFYYSHHQQRERDSYTAIPEEKLWTVPLHMGLAIYYVRSEDPLTLIHLPYGDHRHASAEKIRELTLPKLRDYQTVHRQQLDSYQP